MDAWGTLSSTNSISFIGLETILQISWIKGIGYFTSLAFFRIEAFKKAPNIYTV